VNLIMVFQLGMRDELCTKYGVWTLNLTSKSTHSVARLSVRDERFGDVYFVANVNNFLTIVSVAAFSLSILSMNLRRPFGVILLLKLLVVANLLPPTQH
jgi:hypothetical protein